jgi:hypothetical protein
MTHACSNESVGKIAAIDRELQAFSKMWPFLMNVFMVVPTASLDTIRKVPACKSKARSAIGEEYRL